MHGDPAAHISPAHISPAHINPAHTHLHSKLEEEKADALREASNLRSRLADKETELKRLKDSLQSTIRSLEEDKSAAGVEVGKLKKAIVALESEKNQALRDVARLKGELEVKETDLRVCALWRCCIAMECGWFACYCGCHVHRALCHAQKVPLQTFTAHAVCM